MRKTPHFAILALALAMLGANASAQLSSENTTVTATTANSTVTFTKAPGSVQLLNDGSVIVYVAFNGVAVADASGTVAVGACEAVTVSFNGVGPSTAGLITGSGSATVHVLGIPRTSSSEPLFNTAQVVSRAANNGCPATSQVTSTRGASWLPYKDEELITLDTGGLTTNSQTNLLHANSVIDAVICHQVTPIATSTAWGLSDPTTANRFSGAVVIATADILGIGQWSGAVSTLAAGPSQATAAPLRITSTGSNPTAGAVFCAVFGRTASPGVR